MKYCFWIVLLAVWFNRCDAGWSTWSNWSSCSHTCGHGIKTRERTCDNGTCVGPHEIHMACFENACITSPTATWSSWGDWGTCSRTCGGGDMARERTCSTGHAPDCCEHQDEASCRREYRQSRECVNDDCYGLWSEWRPWEACSAPCGEGLQSRSRECLPQGANCPGRETQERTCYVQCPASDHLHDAWPSDCDGHNPCQNGGICENTGDHVQCRCQGDWRGPDCTSMCLDPSDEESCSNKFGLYHDCRDCYRFIACASGKVVSLPCVPGRLWTGSGCSAPEETNTICINS